MQFEVGLIQRPPLRLAPLVPGSAPMVAATAPAQQWRLHVLSARLTMIPDTPLLAHIEHWAG
jgi:hypothetical protein